LNFSCKKKLYNNLVEIYINYLIIHDLKKLEAKCLRKSLMGIAEVSNTLLRRVIFGNFAKLNRGGERERGNSHPPRQKVVEKSSFCTHCDDGDDDACDL
jgi:hypothetical protein